MFLWCFEDKMRIEITKKSLIITPAPTRNKKNGIKLYFWRGEYDERGAVTFPIITTNIIKGQRIYTLPGKEFSYSIKRIDY